MTVKMEKLREYMDELYLECEHGDQEHRQWLKDKFDDFYERKLKAQNEKALKEQKERNK